MKYPTLRVIAVILKVLAYIAIVGACIGIIAGVIVSVSIGIAKGVSVILLSILYGVIFTVGCLMQSEFIRLFIDLEQNTRDIIEAIHKLTISSSGEFR